MGEPGVERAEAERQLPMLVEEPGAGQRLQVEDHDADRDADARFAVADRENAQRQVLDRRVRMAVGTVDPTGPRLVVGFVESGHLGSWALGKSAQAWS